jgi:hypothetical protein
MFRRTGDCKLSKKLLGWGRRGEEIWQLKGSHPFLERT